MRQLRGDVRTAAAVSNRHVHVFPVDESFLPTTDRPTLADFEAAALEAWKEICNFGRRITFTGGERWAELCCDGLECWRIEEDPAMVVRDLSSS